MAAKNKSKKTTQPKQVNEEALRTFVRKQAEVFLADPNITSIGIGHKQVSGKGTPELSIQFTVRKKVGDSQIEKLGSSPIPKMVSVNGFKVPTDVLEREYKAGFQQVTATLKSSRKTRLGILVPGISVSHPEGTAGTLGAIVYDANDGTTCMLSNWHVLQTADGVLGDAVVQPGPFDDNRVDKNRAGTLIRSHLGVAGDCAIARVDGRQVDPIVLGLGVRPSKLGRASLNDKVVKSGRTTEVTYGIVRRVDVTAKLNYGGSAGEQLIGGFEVGPDPARPAANQEISMGGDSGAAWIATDKKGKPTDVLLGLHFGGETEANSDDHALACYAHSVFEKLEIALQPPKSTPQTLEAVTLGYDESFLGDTVQLPTLTNGDKKDAVSLNGARHIPYTHFTVVQSRSRRMPRYVAWNIDGSSLRKLSRKGLDFVLDPRLESEDQTGNEAYADNKLDRGHVARRADLTWGGATEARQANRDSFYFTNITPQHQAFNQAMRGGLWGRLEDAIYEDLDIEKLRVSVFGGPIFGKDDLEYRGVQVPAEFWKCLCFVDAADHELKAKAYVLTQADLLDDIEAFELDPFRLWSVSISELQSRTGLGFADLLAADDFESGQAPQALARGGRHRKVREVVRREDLF